MLESIKLLFYMSRGLLCHPVCRENETLFCLFVYCLLFILFCYFASSVPPSDAGDTCNLVLKLSENGLLIRALTSSTGLRPA